MSRSRARSRHVRRLAWLVVASMTAAPPLAAEPVVVYTSNDR